MYPRDNDTIAIVNRVTRRHNFVRQEIISLAKTGQLSSLKAEESVVIVKEVIDAVGDSVSVFNGRGGLEITDNIAAGCAGIIPAPDLADYWVKVFDLQIAGNRGEAERIYHPE